MPPPACRRDTIPPMALHFFHQKHHKNTPSKPPKMASAPRWGGFRLRGSLLCEAHLQVAVDPVSSNTDNCSRAPYSVSLPIAARVYMLGDVENSPVQRQLNRLSLSL